MPQDLRVFAPQACLCAKHTLCRYMIQSRNAERGAEPSRTQNLNPEPGTPNPEPRAMPLRIKTAAVIGAGTMGAQVAAHLANAGVGTLLLDVTRDAAREGLERARGLSPDPFYTPTAHTLIRTGGLDDDLAATQRKSTGSLKLSSSSSTSSVRCSSGSKRIGALNAIVSSNTSGIPISALAEGRSRRIPPALSGHALLQPAALSAPARGDPDARYRTGRRRHRLQRSPITTWARASSSQRTRPASSRTTSVCYGVMQVFRALERGELHDRGNRCDHRSGDRPAEERDVPDDGHRRDRRARARRARSVRAAGECRGQGAFCRSGDCGRLGAPGLDRREERPGVLQEDCGRRDPDARSRDDGVSADAAGAASVARRGANDPGPSRASANTARRTGQGRQVPQGHAGAHAGLCRARHTRDRSLSRRRGSRHAVGFRMGAGAVRASGRGHAHALAADGRSCSAASSAAMPVRASST